MSKVSIWPYLRGALEAADKRKPVIDREVCRSVWRVWLVTYPSLSLIIPLILGISVMALKYGGGCQDSLYVVSERKGPTTVIQEFP